jgi:hypothetical protein
VLKNKIHSCREVRACPPGAERCPVTAIARLAKCDFLYHSLQWPLHFLGPKTFGRLAAIRVRALCSGQETGPGPKIRHFCFFPYMGMQSRFLLHPKSASHSFSLLFTGYLCDDNLLCATESFEGTAIDPVAAVLGPTSGNALIAPIFKLAGHVLD